MKRRHFGNGNIILRSMSAYLVVLIVVISGMMILNLNSSSTRILEDAKRANKSMLAQSRQLIDITLKEIDRTAIMLLDDPQLRRIIVGDQTMNFPRAQSITTLLNKFQNQIAAQPLIHSIYVYSENSNYLFTQEFYRTAMAYPDTGWIEGYNNANKTVKWLSTRHATMPPVSDINGPIIKENVVTLIRLYPLNSLRNGCRGALVINLKERELRKLIELDNISGTSISVVDDSGQIILSTGIWHLYDTIKSIPELSSAIVASSGGEVQAKLEGDISTIYFDRSSYTGWTYLAVAYHSTAYKPIEALRTALALIALGMLALAAVAVYFVSNWTYKPIQAFLSNLVKKLGATPQNASNTAALTFEDITDRFSDIITDRERMHNQLIESLPAVRWRLIMDILTGTTSDFYGISEKLQFMGAGLLPYNYIVMVAELSEMKLEVDERASYLLTSSLLKIVERAISEAGVGVALELGDGLVGAIISFPNGRRDENLSRVKEAASLICSEVQNYLHHRISIGIGDHWEALQHIKRSYSEAMEALKRHGMEGTHPILCYPELPAEDGSAEYAIYAQINSLCASLRICTANQMEQRLERIFEESKASNINIDQMLTLCHTLILQANIVIRESGVAVDDNFRKNTFEARHKLSNCTSAAQMKSILSALLDEYLIRISSKYSSSAGNNHHAALVSNHIAAFYSDTNLSLASTAEALGFSAPYISRIFRESTGENFLESLTKLRVKNAQELLSKNGAKVNDVAQMVGYTSVHTFIRSFKKVTGRTPGEWSKMA